VVGLHADEGDVDWRFLSELPRLGQVERAGLDRERLDVADMGDPETIAADGLDIFRPRIDVRHVFAGLDHVSAGVTPDGSRADDRYLLFRHHVFSRIGGRYRYRVLRCRS